MAVIALVRHGETEWNRLGKIQGSSNIPLNETGINQAFEFANRILEEFEYTWDHIYSSPLVRARQTAEELAKRLNKEIVDLPGIHERHYGAGEGLTSAEVRERYGQDVPEKESVESVRARSVSTVMSLAETHADENVVVISHGGTMRVILETLTDGLAPAQGKSIPNTGIHLVEHNETELWVPGFQRVSRQQIEDILGESLSDPVAG